MHLNKCVFFYLHVKYLKHIIYLGYLGIIKNKIEVLASISKSKNMNKLKAFLRLVDFYQKFVVNFSYIIKSLTMLTKNDKKKYRAIKK